MILQSQFYELPKNMDERINISAQCHAVWNEIVLCPLRHFTKNKWLIIKKF